MSDLIARLDEYIAASAPSPEEGCDCGECEHVRSLIAAAAALRQKELDELADEADLREMAEMLRDTMKRAEKAERELAELRAQQPVAWRFFDGFMWTHTGVADFADEWRARGYDSQPLYPRAQQPKAD